MRLLDSRRLFGKNLMLDGPAAIAEVAFEDGEDPEGALATWAARLEAWLPGYPRVVRRFAGGAALCVAGFFDELLALCDANEAAALGVGATPEELCAQVAAARDPLLRALAVECEVHALPLLVDDEQLSVGLGCRSQTFPRGAPPRHLPDGLGRVPVGLVTGTNGKTTSARLAGRMAERAGFAVGVASTDAISVRGVTIARGDYTGPEAARRVLRHPEVDLAVLETARGGILRRGLAVDDVDAALITNVGDDHLGLYGIDDVRAMARVKAVVGRAVRPGGTVVVNGDDPELAALAWPQAQVVRFSTRGAADWHVDGGHVARRGERLCLVAELPIAFGGAAEYNVANALGAAALAAALGVADEAIVAALRGFDAADNPGRGNVHDVGGAKVVLDFAHNPDSVHGLMQLLPTLRGPGGRLVVVVGQPGDRRDEAIRAVAAEIAAAGATRVVVHELADYLRGREPGVVPALLRQTFAQLGVAVEEAPGEAAALEQALAGTRPGDVVALFPLLDAAGVGVVIDRRRRATLTE